MWAQKQIIGNRTDKSSIISDARDFALANGKGIQTARRTIYHSSADQNYDN